MDLPIFGIYFEYVLLGSSGCLMNIMPMRKIPVILLLIITMLGLQSCGTISGGGITDYQRHKPPRGMARRQIRPWVFIGDLFCVMYAPISLGVDFWDGAIYRPKPKVNRIEHITAPGDASTSQPVSSSKNITIEHIPAPKN